MTTVWHFGRPGEESSFRKSNFKKVLKKVLVRKENNVNLEKSNEDTAVKVESNDRVMAVFDENIRHDEDDKVDGIKSGRKHKKMK